MIKNIIDFLDEYKLPYFFEKIFDGKEVKIESFYLNKNVGIKSVYIPFMDKEKWGNLSENEQKKIIKEYFEKQKNYVPTSEEIEEHYRKKREKLK